MPSRVPQVIRRALTFWQIPFAVVGACVIVWLVSQAFRSSLPLVSKLLVTALCCVFVVFIATLWKWRTSSTDLTYDDSWEFLRGAKPLPPKGYIAWWWGRAAVLAWLVLVGLVGIIGMAINARWFEGW